MSTSSNVIGRGVRIPRRSLDAFLQRHNLPPSHPGGLFEEDAEAISELFARLGVQGSKLRFLEPRLTNFKPADHLFLCYDWVYVLAEKEVEASLRKEGPPEGFWEVVREICGGGGGGGGDEARELKVGTWVLCIEKEWGLFQEKKFRDSVSVILQLGRFPVFGIDSGLSDVFRRRSGVDCAVTCWLLAIRGTCSST